MLKFLKILNTFLTVIYFFVIINNAFDIAVSIKDLINFFNFEFINVNQELKTYLNENCKINNYDVLNMRIENINTYEATIQSQEFEHIRFNIKKEKDIIVDDYEEKNLLKQRTIDKQIVEIRSKLYYMLHDFSYEYEQADLKKPDQFDDFMRVPNKFFLVVYCISPENVIIGSDIDYSNYGIEAKIVHSEINREKNYTYDSIIKFIKTISLNFKHKNFSIDKFDFTFRNFHSLEEKSTKEEHTKYYHEGKHDDIYIKDLTLEQISNYKFDDHFKNNVETINNVDVGNVESLYTYTEYSLSEIKKNIVIK